MVSGEFRVGQRVHWTGDARRTGMVKYIGNVEGYDGQWVGVDWDGGDGKHDGSLNGVSYFRANSPKSGSFVRPHNLSCGVTFLEALRLRYQSHSTPEDAGLPLFSSHFVFELKRITDGWEKVLA